MIKKIVKLIRLFLLLAVVALLSLWGVRAYDAWRSPPLQLWHTVIPKEMSVAEMDGATWQQYMEREEAIFAAVRRDVTEKLPPEAQVQSNRFFEGSRVYPPNLSHNWNRSYVMEPEGPVKGAVVLLHGLTDAPFSLRHVARRYRDDGFVAIGLRVPAHGTVPAALTATTWEEWMAATRLAVREAKRRIEPGMPLHIVGFSNGGALAMKYALDVLDDPTLVRADRLILISPMIGITRFARFAGIAAVPAFFPAFAKTAWLGVLPEFNPFKYNSFPVNGARQSHRLTAALQQQINRLSREESFNTLPPVLTFQSALDYTVSTPAILYALYAHLPENGSALVLFDVNRATIFSPLMRSASEFAVNRLLPTLPQRYDITIVGNAHPDTLNTVARTTKAGQTEQSVLELNLRYPAHVFSLSHVALPFPMDDPLYGMEPPPGSDVLYGVNLGTMAARGERGALVVNLDSLFRTSSNPFFPYLMERIIEGIDNPLPTLGALTPRSQIVIPPPSAAYLEDEKNFLYDENADNTYEVP